MQHLQIKIAVTSELFILPTLLHEWEKQVFFIMVDNLILQWTLKAGPLLSIYLLIFLYYLIIYWWFICLSILWSLPFGGLGCCFIYDLKKKKRSIRASIYQAVLTQWIFAHCCRFCYFVIVEMEDRVICWRLYSFKHLFCKKKMLLWLLLSSVYFLVMYV